MAASAALLLRLQALMDPSVLDLRAAAVERRPAPPCPPAPRRLGVVRNHEGLVDALPGSSFTDRCDPHGTSPPSPAGHTAARCAAQGTGPRHSSH